MLSVEPDVPDAKRIVVRASRRDTVVSVARRYGVSPRQVQSWNKLSGTKLVAGQSLVLMVRPNSAAAARAARDDDDDTPVRAATRGKPSPGPRRQQVRRGGKGPRRPSRASAWWWKPPRARVRPSRRPGPRRPRSCARPSRRRPPRPAPAARAAGPPRTGRLPAAPISPMEACRELDSQFPRKFQRAGRRRCSPPPACWRPARRRGRWPARSGPGSSPTVAVPPMRQKTPSRPSARRSPRRGHDLAVGPVEPRTACRCSIVRPIFPR